MCNLYVYMDSKTAEVTSVKTKTIRVHRDAEKIALRYGSTVSKGIIEMEYRLQHPSSPNAPCVPGQEPLSSDGISPEYWKRLKKELDVFIEQARRGY